MADEVLTPEAKAVLEAADAWSGHTRIHEGHYDSCPLCRLADAVDAWRASRKRWRVDDEGPMGMKYRVVNGHCRQSYVACVTPSKTDADGIAAALNAADAAGERP